MCEGLRGLRARPGRAHLHVTCFVLIVPPYRRARPAPHAAHGGSAARVGRGVAAFPAGRFSPPGHGGAARAPLPRAGVLPARAAALPRVRGGPARGRAERSARAPALPLQARPQPAPGLPHQAHPRDIPAVTARGRRGGGREGKGRGKRGKGRGNGNRRGKGREMGPGLGGERRGKYGMGGEKGGNGKWEWGGK